MLRKTLYALAVAALAFGTPPAMAQEKGHAHKQGEAHQHAEGEKGAHGGPVQDVAGYEAELVIAGNTVALYLVDHATDKPVDPVGMQASVLFTQGTARKGTVALKPVSDRLEGQGAMPEGADAVVSLRTKDGKTAQARFELGGHAH